MPIRLLLAAAFCVFMNFAAGQNATSPLSPEDYKKLRVQLLMDDLGLPVPASFDQGSLQALVPAIQKWATGSTLPMLDPKKVPLDDLVASTYPKLTTRYFQSTVSKFELVDQPRDVVLDTASGGTTDALNPNRHLFRYSGVTNYAVLIPSVGDVSDQAAALDGVGVDMSTAKTSICTVERFNHKNTEDSLKSSVNCIRRTGVGNRFGRLLAGNKGTLNLGQNPVIQQGLLVTGTAAAAKNFAVSGGDDFDPRGLFLTGTDWNTAAKSARLYGPAADSAFRDRVKSACGKNSDQLLYEDAECVRKIEGPTGWSRVAAIVLPEVNFTLSNRFDFVKRDEILVQEMYPTKHILDLIFSVDLSRAFVSSKARQDALAMLASLRKDPPSAKSNPKMEVLRLFGELVSQPDRLANDDWYQGFRKALVSAKN